MEDQPSSDSASLTPPPAVLPARPRGSALTRWLARRGVELLTVFMGVYTAFLLNAYEQRRQEKERRAQLLNWIDTVYHEEAVSIQREAAELRRQADEFNHALASGTMPALHAFSWQSDYDPSDIPGLLQSSGYDLLEVDTVRAIKEADGTLRRMVVLLHHDQQLSDALVLPQLGKGLDVFYDPGTRQLRESYRWYQTFFQRQLDGYAELKPEVDQVLARIQAERRRNR